VGIASANSWLFGVSSASLTLSNFRVGALVEELELEAAHWVQWRFIGSEADFPMTTIPELSGT
jgi:hypothetical protein